MFQISDRRGLQNNAAAIIFPSGCKMFNMLLTFLFDIIILINECNTIIRFHLLLRNHTVLKICGEKREIMQRREAMLELLNAKPYSKISVTELCRLAEINRGTFYLHYYDVDDVLDDILNLSFSDVSSTIDHVLCPHKETCTYPLCRKVQENAELRPLFLDDTISERIIQKLSDGNQERFVTYLMQHSDLTFPQAEAVFYFQINGCLTVNRLMLKNHCADWHTVQQTVDRFIRAGLRELLHDEV